MADQANRPVIVELPNPYLIEPWDEQKVRPRPMPRLPDDIEEIPAVRKSLNKWRVITFFMAFILLAVMIPYWATYGYQQYQIHAIAWAIGIVFLQMVQIGMLFIEPPFNKFGHEPWISIFCGYRILWSCWMIYGCVCFIEAFVYLSKHGYSPDDSPCWILVIFLFVADQVNSWSYFGYAVCCEACDDEIDQIKKKRDRIRKEKRDRQGQREERLKAERKFRAQQIEIERQIARQLAERQIAEHEIERRVQERLGQSDYKINVKIPGTKTHRFYDECTICTDKFKSDDMVKDLSCKHIFHTSCVDRWLLTSEVCPTCKCKVEG
jgi:hypothetical protein